jgi:hypothetical protein
MMLRKTFLLLAAALLCMGAAPAAKPAAPKPAATKPAPAKAAPPAGPFDMRDPASLIAVLKAAGAAGEVARKDDDSVLVSVTSVAVNFSMQYAGCERSGRNCKAVLFDAPTDGAPTFAQLNAFDQTSATCRAYQDRSGKAHVVYSALLFADDSRPHAVTHLAAWQGCVAEFRAFLSNPNAYLAEAP